MKLITANEVLNLKGVPCPQNSAKALLKLASMDFNEILEIIIDDGEPKENVPSSIESDENYKVITLKKYEDNSWHLLVKVIQ
ncbi:MAG: hypothetical protein A2X08_01960 [Bacteroidetes bacterium GWA2_32_17]|nr:MAG: hypothetical protein A2X08_01960 [Bacteroidetes bacterium GWA2_32_17]